MKYYIYKLTFKSGSTYIGQHIEKKENDGYISSSVYMQRHPEDPVINREILLYVKDKETLDIMETLCIRGDKAENPKNVNGTYGNWHYNFTFKGWHHSDKKKRDTSEQFKKLWQNPEYKNKIVSVHIGRKNTEETKRLMSQSALNSWTEERRRQASESGNYSHAHTEETKKHLSELRKGKKWINNGKEEKSVVDPTPYIAQGWKIGKLPVSDETKKNMSEAAKRRPCNTVGKKKIHKGDIGKFVSVEELQTYLDDGWELGVSDKRKELLRQIAKK